MKKYKVVFCDEIYYNIEVKAKNEKVAEKKAEELWHDGEADGECLEHLLLSTEEIKEWKELN